MHGGQQEEEDEQGEEEGAESHVEDEGLHGRGEDMGSLGPGGRADGAFVRSTEWDLAGQGRWWWCAAAAGEAAPARCAASLHAAGRSRAAAAGRFLEAPDRLACAQKKVVMNPYKMNCSMAGVEGYSTAGYSHQGPVTRVIDGDKQ